jgi:uncharacterized protein (DUF1800 family)
MKLRSLIVWMSVVVLGALAILTLAATDCSAESGPAKKPGTLTSTQRASHALNRLTFGPHPQDLAEVQAMGVNRWIEFQLHPETIDDAELQSLLRQLPAMQLSEAKLFQKFPPNPMVRRMETTGSKLPADPIERAIYANAIANVQTQQQKKAAEQAASANPAAKPAASTETKAVDPADDNSRKVFAAKADRILAMPMAQQRFQALLALPAGEPRKVLQGMRPVDRQHLVEGMDSEQKEAVVALADINRVIAGEAMEQKLLYDIYSNRQLQEVMTDFWLNHFNVYMRKSGIAPWEIATYERDVIRPHVFGKFEELLDVVATSPAMMTYLDNAESIGPDSVAAQNAGRRNNLPGGKPGPARGLNENYARELMELHTLGVNGGYTQRDVTEVAKVFTGWTVDAPRDGGSFTYNDRRHEPGTKIVLGKTIAENGQQEGFEVLHILASSPATAHFLSRELAVRFVSDDPPQALVNRMAKKYLSSHGDIRQVLRVMFQSQEFWSPTVYDVKVKTPLEFVVSSVRATNADATQPQSLIAALNQMGMPLYGMQPPTGYSTTADKWVSSEQLITRMNFALALTSNKLPGIRCELPPGVANESAEQSEAQLERVLLNGDVSSRTRATVVAEMNELTAQQKAGVQAPLKPSNPPPPATVDPMAIKIPKKNGAARPVDFNRGAVDAGDVPETVAAGLLLGSPDFQHH